MKLSVFVPIVAMAALAASPVMSSHLYKRHDAEVPFQRPITPANCLKTYIQAAEVGVKLLNDSLNESIQAGKTTTESLRLNEQGTFALTAALGDAAYALRAGKIQKEEAQLVGPLLKNLTDEIKPIAEKVGSLKPFYDQMGPDTSKRVAVALQYLAGSFDKFYQALKAILDANAKQTVAGNVLDVICAIDAASVKLDSCTPLTDAKFCKKSEDGCDWEALPHQCPGMDKCKGDDIRKALYATYTTKCIHPSCRGDDWCKKSEGKDLCQWTPNQWMN